MGPKNDTDQVAALKCQNPWYHKYRDDQQGLKGSQGGLTHRESEK